MTRAAAILAIGLLLAAAQAPAQSWRIYPPVPTAGEPFVIQHEGATGNGPDVVRSASVSVQGSNLTFSVDVEVVDFSAGGAYRASTLVPGLAAGQYQVVLQRRFNSTDVPAASLGTITVAAAQEPAQPRFRDLAGNWFDPAESGWGMNIVQGDSGSLFAVWLTYLPVFQGNIVGGRQDGMWLVMSDGRWLTPTQFRGLLYATVGSSISRPFNRNDLVVTPVGYLTIDLSNVTQATMKAEAGVGLYAPFAKEAVIRRFQF